MEWKPIETAPKDGTAIMLCKGKRVTCGEWITGTNLGSMDYHATTGEPVGYPDAEDYAMWASWDGGFSEDDPPTHWAPMPDPPND